MQIQAHQSVTEQQSTQRLSEFFKRTSSSLRVKLHIHTESHNHREIVNTEIDVNSYIPISRIRSTTRHPLRIRSTIHRPLRIRSTTHHPLQTTTIRSPRRR